MAAPDAPLILLVCGGRHYADTDAVNRALTTASPAIVVTGACPTGADRYAGDWCQTNGVPLINVPALWVSEGNAAGPLRNARMLNYARTLADRLMLDEMRFGVCAFPGGRGTEGMVELATDAKCRVWRPAG